MGKSVWQNDILDENDFTKSGEPIPKDAGILDFIKYNTAHFDPTSEDAMLGMAGTSGGIAKKMTKVIPKLSSQLKAALESQDGLAAEYMMNNRIDHSLRKKFGPRYESDWKDIVDKKSSRLDSDYLSPMEHNLKGEEATLDNGSAVKVIDGWTQNNRYDNKPSTWVRVESSPAMQFNMELEDFLHRATPGWGKVKRD